MKPGSVSASRLRILSVVHGFPPESAAGAELYCLHLALSLQGRGHHCSILTRSPDFGDGTPEFSLRKEEYKKLSVWRVSHRLQHERLSEAYIEPRIDAVFRKVLAAERPDVVHFQHLLHLSAGMVFQCRALNIPTVVHCHDYWSICPRVQLIRPNGVLCEGNMGAGCFPCSLDFSLSQIERVTLLERSRPLVLDELERGERRGEPITPSRRKLWQGIGDIRRRPAVVIRAYQEADLALAPSRFLRQKLIDSGFQEDHLRYSPYGLPPRSPGSVRPDRNDSSIRFGYIGALVHHKGVHVLLEALRMLGNRGIELRIYGAFDPKKDPYHLLLQGQAEGLNVRFLGAFSSRDLDRVHRAIDVLVVPSIWNENSPFVVHEAAQSGIPCVVSDRGGMKELVRHGVSGFHFASGDATDLMRKLASFVEDPTLLDRLKWPDGSVRTIEENAKEMEATYRELIQQRRNGPGAAVHGQPATAAITRSGNVVREDDDLVLKAGGRCRVEYVLGPLGTGRRLLRLIVPVRSDEQGGVFGGRITLDGEVVGGVGPFSAGGTDELRQVDVPVELSRDGATLGIENLGREDGLPYTLRLQRVEVIDLDAGSPPPIPGQVVRDATGWEWQSVTGDVQRQGPDMAILGPGLSEVDLDLTNVPPGPVEVAVWIPVMTKETDVLLGGRVFLDEKEIGALGPVVSLGGEEIRIGRVYGVVTGETKSLRFMNSLVDQGPPLRLRIKRVVVTGVSARVRSHIQDEELREFHQRLHESEKTQDAAELKKHARILEAERDSLREHSRNLELEMAVARGFISRPGVARVLGRLRRVLRSRYRHPWKNIGSCLLH